MNTLRNVCHGTLAVLGGFVWLVVYFLTLLMIALSWLGDRLIPGSDMGNCYSYALPRWAQYRGALVLTFVEDVRLLGILPVVHATWAPRGVHNLTETETTVPVRRRSTQWVPWYVFYFKFKVRTWPATSGDPDNRPL